MSIGFKEWALVCEALGNGDQSIILRKGGIAEGRAGFRFQHDEFLLMPTLFHEQVAKLKVAPGVAMPEARTDGMLEVRYQAHVRWTLDITDLTTVRRLAPFHIWQDEVIDERFRYDEKQGVSLAFVRISRLSKPFCFADSPRYGGCRSWVTLPDLADDITTEDVLPEQEVMRREKEIRALVEN